MTDADLIAAIYEAAIVPGHWPKVLGDLGGLVGAQAAAVVTYAANGTMRHAETERYSEAFADFAANGAGMEHVRPARSLEMNPAGFSFDLEVCTPEEIEADPLFVRFIRPYGFGSTSGTAVPAPSGDLIVFDVTREAGDAPFTRADMGILDLYRPHLARAGLLASRLGLEQARAAAEVLQTVGLPAAAITADGRVLAANPGLESLAPVVVFRAFDHLALADRAANAMLAASIDELGGEAAGTPRSIPLAATEQRPAMILHVVPVRREARDLFAATAALVIVTLVTAPELPLTGLLHGLFDLTPAEARLARLIANGRALTELAAEGRASIETLRSQLKSIMHKTGTRRQVDLVRLLLAARPVAGAGIEITHSGDARPSHRC